MSAAWWAARLPDDVARVAVDPQDPAFDVLQADPPPKAVPGAILFAGLLLGGLALVPGQDGLAVAGALLFAGACVGAAVPSWRHLARTAKALDAVAGSRIAAPYAGWMRLFRQWMPVLHASLALLFAGRALAAAAPGAFLPLTAAGFLAMAVFLAGALRGRASLVAALRALAPPAPARHVAPVP